MALVVVFLLAAARCELTLAQNGAPDSNFFPIAHKSTFLPRQVLVRNMREDRDGNIWFASSAGPIRYDGKTFTNFGEEAGIAGRVLFSLTIDKSGALWFGSITGGASKYDGKSFTRFTTKEGLSGDGVSWMFEDERGDIWFATGGGVSRYDGKTFTNYSTKDGLPHNSVYVIAQDRSGKLWFGTQEGIASYDGKTFTNFAGIAGREFQNIRSIVEDQAGNLWFGGQFGVYRYDGKTGTMLTAKDGLLEDFVGSMIVDKAGGVWFGHPQARADTQGGATRYDGKAFTHFTQKEGLPSENVYSMFEDREGRIWFGSVANFGTSRYDGKTFTNFSAASPTNAELQLLQGTWEGGEGDGKITITITGNSLHFHRDTNFWFETTITLPAGKDPKQFHATIKDCPPSQASSMGKVVGAIFKIEDGTLTIVASGSLEEMPKSFEASETQGLSRFELRKVQPQKKNTELPKSMRGSGLGSLVLEGHELHVFTNF
jgi:streptogramin lyase